MIKKIITILLVLLVCFGCSSKKNDINYTYDIVSYPVDMSKYDGVNSTDHMFKRITVDQLFNCIDNKSSGIFYLGRTNCGCCQTCISYMNEAAKQLNVYIYYIDVYDPDMPLIIPGEDCPECKANTEKLREYIWDILEITDSGEKELQTPTVFSVINGEFGDHLICMSNYSWDNPPTDAQKEKLINRYKQIFEPFVE